MNEVRTLLSRRATATDKQNHMAEPPAEPHDDSSSADEVSYEDIPPSIYDDVPPPAEGELESDRGAPALHDVEFNRMDAAKIAELYTAKLAAADNEPPVVAKRKTAVGRSASKPKLGAASGNTVAARRGRGNSAAAAAPTDPSQPHSTFSAQIRCAVRAGTAVWAAERDGCVVVREAASGSLVERILPNADWEKVLSLAVVDKAIWAGTSNGPIVIFDRASRKLVAEARHHTGGVTCICASPSPHGRAFVISGGSDFRTNMWHTDGRFMKTFSGHTGGVRCALVMGSEIWTGSDDSTIRVWDAAFGLFDLETQPCRATLNGHTAAVHSLLTHSGGVLSCSADGNVCLWKSHGARECLREVALHAGPLYQLASAGRCVWVAAADGAIHSLDGVTLEASHPARQNAHNGFVSGLCALQARTTRQIWSFSTSDGRVNRWRIDEVDGQHSAERAGVLGTERDAIAGQLSQEQAARKEEQTLHAERQREAAERLAETEAALSEARDGQQKLLEELAVSMDVQERDLQEAERLRALLAQREAESEARERQHAAVAEAADAALKDALSRLAAAEEEARRQREELDAQAAIASAQEAAARRHQAAAERLALSSIARAVRIWRDARQAAAADDESTQHFTSSTTQDGVDSDAPLTRAAFWGDTGAARAVADEGADEDGLDGGQVETLLAPPQHGTDEPGFATMAITACSIHCGADGE